MTRSLHRLAFPAAGVVALAVGAVACGRTPVPAASRAAVSVERGEYLVTVAGCNDCHTPRAPGPRGPEPDMSRRLSGHPEQVAMPPAPKLDAPWVWAGAATNTAFVGPWGVSYATNLTPDVNTGLGIWTEEQFLQTLRTGRHFGAARPILPPMPWPGYARMTDDDLKSIFAYLRSIPAVKNYVPDALPASAPSEVESKR